MINFLCLFFSGVVLVDGIFVFERIGKVEEESEKKRIFMMFIVGVSWI